MVPNLITNSGFSGNDTMRICGQHNLLLRLILLVAALVLSGIPGVARAKCLPIAQRPALVLPAAAPAAGSIALTYFGHSSFLIETSGGAMAVTDYYGFPLPALPDVVTMNNAHGTHYTDVPDPRIPHVLRGWSSGMLPVTHDVAIEDLRIWNVPTNVRDAGGTRFNGNSIFVFESAGLCIAHLGHLHHTLTDQHRADLGEIDVLLVPADGSYTLPIPLLVEVIGQIGPSLVIPMHYFGDATLAGFLGLMQDDGYAVVLEESTEFTISRLTMPHRTVLVLGAR